MRRLYGWPRLLSASVGPHLEGRDVTKQLPVVLAGTFALYLTFLFFLGGGHPDPLVLIDLPVLFALEWLCPQSALVYTAAYAVSSTLMWAVPGWAIGTVLQQQNASPISF